MGGSSPIMHRQSFDARKMRARARRAGIRCDGCRSARSMDPPRQLWPRADDRKRCLTSRRARGIVANAMNTQTIPAPSLAPQDIQEQRDCLHFVVKVMGHRLSRGADPAPAARQTRSSKQRPLNRHGIEASHVCARIRSLDIEMIGLIKHGTTMGQGGAARPTRVLNRSQPIDSKR